MNRKLNVLTALIAFASSTAFAAAAAPSKPAATPRTGAAAAPTQAAPVCMPGSRGDSRSDRGPRAQGTQPSTSAATPAGMAPPALKNTPARPTTAAATPENCGPQNGPRAGRDGPDGRGQQGQAGQQGQRPGPGALGGQRDAPGTDAERQQRDLKAVDALLATTTDARARAYLTDARALLVSGNPRAARGLIHAAQALTGPQK